MTQCSYAYIERGYLCVCVFVDLFARTLSLGPIALITIVSDAVSRCPALLGIVIGDKFSAERLTDIGVLLVSAHAYKLWPLRERSGAFAAAAAERSSDKSRDLA